jgi:hypothetical protein
MDLQTILTDAGTVASIAAAIFVVIDFIKKLYYKLPWGWVQKTPGEVWFALSLIMSFGIMIAIYWDNFFGPSATVGSSISAMVYGAMSGAGSKLIHSVANTAGAKLQANKLENKAKIDVMTDGKQYVEKGSGAQALNNLGTAASAPIIEEMVQECTEEPVVEEEVPAWKKPPRVVYPQDKVKQKTFVVSEEGDTVEFDYIPTEEEIKKAFPKHEPVVELVQKISTEADYVLIDGVRYKIVKDE